MGSRTLKLVLRHRVLTAFAVILVAGIPALDRFYFSDAAPAATVTTTQLSRGRVADEISATGAIQAPTTVQVGTQVSGTIAWLGADFNSIVHKGEVIARLDTSSLQALVDQARATLNRSQSDADRAKVQLADAKLQFERAQALRDKQIIAQTDFDDAQVAVSTADAQWKAAQAMVVQAQASLNQAQVNLGFATITSPIDGIVINRAVDVGQTVAASMSSPTLFTIANDLTHLQVNADVDESDIGHVRPAQVARFTVDAYPNETFTGSVSQVRLQPITVQNVVTYDVIIDVQNRDLKLKPGMTANLKVATAVRDDVLRIPNAALRFRPTAEMFAALKQTPPSGALKRTGPSLLPVDDGEGGDQAVARPRNPNATTVDALFGPLPRVESDGQVWVRDNGILRAVPIRVGVSDGQLTELIAGDLNPESEIVTGISLGAMRPTAAQPSGGLFMPPTRATGNRRAG